MHGLFPKVIIKVNERGNSMKDKIFSLKFLFILPALLVLAIFFIMPYLNMAYISFMMPSNVRPYDFGFTLINYIKNISDVFFGEVLLKTLIMGVASTVICLILGYPVAYHLARTKSRFKSVLFVLVISPLLVGVVIRCYGWMILLADAGLINDILLKLGFINKSISFMYNPIGVLVGLVEVFMPFMILSLLGNLQSIDPELEHTARSLGATRLKTFLNITLPLSLPGILSGSILVFVLSISAYAIPILLGGFKVLTAPLLIVQTILEAFNWPGGASMSLLMFTIMLIVILSYIKIMNQLMRGLK